MKKKYTRRIIKRIYFRTKQTSKQTDTEEGRKRKSYTAKQQKGQESASKSRNK